MRIVVRRIADRLVAKWLVVVGAGLLWSCSTLAPEETPSTTDVVTMPDRVTVPLLPGYQHAVVAVVIGGQTYHFAIDTGSPVCLVSPRVVKDHPDLFSSVPETEDSGQRIAELAEFSVGQARFSKVTALVQHAAQDVIGIAGFDGLVGMSVLGKQYFELNLRDKTLLLAKTAPTLSNAVAIGDLWDGSIVIDGSVGGEKARWSIDTGNPGTYYFRSSYFSSVDAVTTFHPFDGVQAKGFYFQDTEKDPGLVSARDVVFGTQKFAAAAFRNLEANPAYMLNDAVFTSIAGYLPLSFFADGVLKVDYPHRLVAWTVPPGQEPPLTDDVVNFGLVSIPQTPDRAAVIGLDTEGWAYQAGLRVGDVLVGVSSLEVGADYLTLLQSRKLLEFSGSFPIRLNYERDGVQHHVQTDYYSPFLNDFGPNTN